MRYRTLARIALSVGLGCLSFGTSTATAATLTVTKTTDTNDGVCDADCSLREAIAAAVGDDTVLFSSLFDTPQTITLAGSHLVVDKNLTVAGPGADKLTVSASNQSRVFYVQPLVVASVSGMTITGGNAGYGGGILNEGGLTVNRCHVTGNAAGSGGGIAIVEGSATIRNSTISNNTAAVRGAGIWFENTFGAMLAVINSTISGNTASSEYDAGGGIWAVSVSPLGVQILQSTITNNFPGGLFAFAPAVGLGNSIVAANQHNSVIPDVDGGPFERFSFNNLIGHATGGFAAAVGNILGNRVVQADPKLGPLAHNGGPTPTHELLPCSLALDRGEDVGLLTDQRGTAFSRPRDGDGDGMAVTDIGAFESQAFTPAVCNTGPPTVLAADPTIQQGTARRLDIAAVSDPDGLFGVGLSVASANPSNGVRLSDVLMLSPGVFSADVAAACSASTTDFTVVVGDLYGQHLVPDRLVVTVTPETTPPAIVLRTHSITPFPNDHKYRTVSMSDLVVSANDACDPSVTLNSVAIESVTSDEPENAPGESDGNTVNDVVISVDCRSVQLRAERDGSGDGRVYTVTLRVRDASGNITRAARIVTVPLSHNGEPAIDSGPRYTVASGCPSGASM